MRESPRLNGHEEKSFVSIRVRPLNEKERARHDVLEWECVSANTIQFKNPLPESSFSMDAYTFDRVFGDGCFTQQVYEEGIKQVAFSVVSGINSSIFAYGQTSSGKTYTMTGITEFAVRDIYDYIETHKDREFVLKFSAMEIYNEVVRDLLRADSTPLRLLDDPEKGTVVEKLTEETVTEWSHLQELLSICAAERTTKETSMNEASSRSHQILRLTVESCPIDYVGSERSGTLIANVNFVDLAGSERASQALTSGTKLREGGHINRSLLTLGTVIRKLSKGRSGHIPYGDSKLTRILQSSLGGNARTAIICTISPTRSHVEQSRNTLFLAGCAKQVTINAQVNEVMSDKILVKQLQNELARMEKELRSFAPKNVFLKERELQIDQQRDIFQSHVENLLHSVGKDQLLKVHKDSASESSVHANNLHLHEGLRKGSTSENPNKPRRIESFFNNHLFQQSENSEDNFLLDGNTPEFVGPDPCQGWEEISSRVDAEYGDNCKEVRCIEDHEAYVKSIPASEDIGGKSPMRLVKNGDAESSSRKGDNEFIHVTVDSSPDALRQKIQDLQRTIHRLVGLSEKSNGSSESYISGSRSVQFARSRSCRPILDAISHLQFDKVDQEIKPRPQFDKLEQKVMSPFQFNKLDEEPASPPQFDKPELETKLSPQFNKLEEETITSPAKAEKDNSTSLVSFQDKLSESKFLAKKRKSSRKHIQTHQMDALYEVESVIDSDTEDTASVLNFVVRMNGIAKTTPSKKDYNDLMENKKMASDATSPQEFNLLTLKPEIDGQLSMKRFASDKLETEGKKFLHGSRKDDNLAFIASQSKFEELSSIANSGRLSNLSCQGTAVESQADTSSVGTDTGFRSKEFLSLENYASYPSRIGGSECGTELSISSTLDSPDRSEVGAVENEREAKDSSEGICNPDKINHDVDANVACAIPSSNLPNSVLDKPEMVDDIDGKMVYTVVAVDSEEPAIKSEKNVSDLHKEQAETALQEIRSSAEASPRSHITVPESQGTPSSQVSVKPKAGNTHKIGSSNKRRPLSAGNKSPANPNHDSGSRASREQLPKDQRSGKRRNSFGSVKPDHVDQESRDNSSSNNSLPRFMQATESARAKVNANNSPRSSPDVHDQDIHVKKRHSLPGSTGRQGSPRIQLSMPQVQQDTKGNVLHSPQERKWQR